LSFFLTPRWVLLPLFSKFKQSIKMFMSKSYPLKIMLSMMQQSIKISSKEITCSLTIIFSSQLQIVNVSPLSIFTFQDFSNDLLKAQFGPH
jgi:hypothetical protein